MEHASGSELPQSLGMFESGISGSVPVAVLLLRWTQVGSGVWIVVPSYGFCI